SSRGRLHENKATRIGHADRRRSHWRWTRDRVRRLGDPFSAAPDRRALGTLLVTVRIYPVTSGPPAHTLAFKRAMEEVLWVASTRLVAVPCEDEPLIALEVHDALRIAGASILAATKPRPKTGQCRGSLMKARQLIDGASFGPEALKVIGQAFDDAWLALP